MDASLPFHAGGQGVEVNPHGPRAATPGLVLGRQAQQGHKARIGRVHPAPQEAPLSREAGDQPDTCLLSLQTCPLSIGRRPYNTKEL